MYQKIIDKFEMQSHPEGGFYKETYRSNANLNTEFGSRSLCTGIYFLLPRGHVSHFHKIKSDEMWHFYGGDSLTIVEIDENGNLLRTKLGTNLEKGEIPQYVVKANRWFGSFPSEDSEYSFVGCTVSFGFDFEDFELANKESLLKLYPVHHEMISKLT
jgi:predicted cupin superfamily sugar epimerase